MLRLEFWLFTGALGGLVLGALSVFLTRTYRGSAVEAWGRTLFVGTLVALGAASLLAAFHRADGLVPLGLSAGSLLVALFIEIPQPVTSEIATMPPPEEL